MPTPHVVLLIANLLGLASGLSTPPSLGGGAARSSTPAAVSRRALLGGVGAAVGAAAFPVLPASASLRSALSEGQDALMRAKGTDEITDALTNLANVLDDYEGLPNQRMKEELVVKMREKRSALLGGEVWNGIPEEAYNRLMRKVDAWRVTELQPIFQGSIIGYLPVYIVLLGVQQLLPKFFPPAYAAGAALLLGPLFFQIIVG